MGSSEWGCCAGLAASRPGPEPWATTFLNQILPPEQASRQAGSGGSPGQAQGIFVSSWLSPQAPRFFLIIAYKSPGSGSRQESSSQASWPSSPLPQPLATLAWHSRPKNQPAHQFSLLPASSSPPWLPPCLVHVVSLSL